MKKLLLVISVLLLAACSGGKADMDVYENDYDTMLVTVSFDESEAELSEVVYESKMDYKYLADSKEEFLDEHEAMYDDRKQFMDAADGISYQFQFKDGHVEEEMTVDYKEANPEHIKTGKIFFRQMFEGEESGEDLAEALLDDGFEKEEVEED